MLIKTPSDIRSSEITAARALPAAARLPRRRRGRRRRPHARARRLQVAGEPTPPARAVDRAAAARRQEGAVRHRRAADAVRATSPPTTTSTSSAPTSPTRRRTPHTLRTRPWTVAFEGEIAKPQVIDIDTLLKLFPLEERVYRLRCVEAWSMVIPWVGFPLGAAASSACEPTTRAKYVAFTTLLAPDQMPGQTTVGARLALRRGAAHRRGDAPAHDPGGRPLRARHAQPGRRAGAPGRALEVRLQEHQVDRQGPLRRAASRPPPGTAYAPARVRLLLEREPGRRSPALEPGERAPHRRARAAARRCRSTATRTRSPASTRAWTCAKNF